MTLDTLSNRVKWLEKQDRIRKAQLAELYWRGLGGRPRALTVCS